MKRVLLTADVSNLLYKATHVNKQLTSEGRFTGGLFGFMKQIATGIQITQATDLLLCFDRKPYVRSIQYPEYKAARGKSADPELAAMVKYSHNLVLELCEVTGWKIFELQGFESDDLIAHCVRKYRHRFDSIVAMSNDSDLYQLFNSDKFSVFKGFEKGIYTHLDYARDFPFTSDEYVLYLALQGTHNEVEGIQGIGPVTARKIVLNGDKLAQIRDQHGKMIDRNVSLITLPHNEFPKTLELPSFSRNYVERNLVRFCGKYDINVTQLMCNHFERITRSK